jgi:hypothetical protein
LVFLSFRDKPLLENCMWCSFIHLANGDNPLAVRAELPCLSAASGDVAFLVPDKNT